MIIVSDRRAADHDRTDAFRDFARRRAEGAVVVPPLMLSGDLRRLYIRETLRENHRFRLQHRPEGAHTKFEKLTASPFVFFRGTALLYYRDYAGTDLHLPRVLVLGDVHPENFGVMPDEHGTPIFGVNDFDEACIAPFSYDVRRGATGFYLCAHENGLGKKERRRAVRAFVDAYLGGLKDFARDDREKFHQYRIDNSPKMIKKLLKKALSSRAAFLEKRVHLDKSRFRNTEEIVPYSKHVEAFQKTIDDYVKDKKNDIDKKERREGFFTVKDVAIKKESGTASLGLDRFWVLIDGRSEAPEDDVILELKQARYPSLYGLIPDEELADEDDPAASIVRAQEVHLVGGDPLYGRAFYDDRSFLVRERSPLKDDIDVEDLDADEMATYAAICGRALAQPHARSDEDTGLREGSVEEEILTAIDPDVFADDMVRFAERAAKRVRKDFKLYKKDFALGAFHFVYHDEEE